MKALIIIPPSPFLNDDRVFPHIGPYYIKKYVEDNSDHEVTVDFNFSLDKDVSEFEVIGFSATTPIYPTAKELAEKIARDKISVIGGPHARHYNLDDEKIWDYIVKGDGCKPFLNILNGKSPGNELDDVNQGPHRDISLHEYKYNLDGNPSTVILTSYGCPNTCKFCEHAGMRVRLKDPAAVKDEIQECVDLGFTGIVFYDDIFCLNLNRVKSLCEVIKPFNIKFRCFAHARNFPEEMAAILSDAGCVEIGYGAEHASQEILDIIDKKTTVEQNYELIKTAHKYNIRVKAFFLIGLPGESHETAAELEKFVLNSNVDDFDVSIYYPYRGTEIADNMDKYDLYLANGDTLGYHKGKGGKSECAVYTSSLSCDEIKYWRDRIYSYRCA